MKTPTQTAALYWDTTDPANPGWAFRVGDESGAVIGDLDEDSPLGAVISAATADLPTVLLAPSRWTRREGAIGWTAAGPRTR